MNLAHECLEKPARRVPNRFAVIDGIRGEKITYRELKDRVDRLANALSARGLAKGDRVALYLPNTPEFIVAFFATIKLGAIALPMNIMYRRMELAYILENSGARFVVGAAAEVAENLAPITSELHALETLITVKLNDDDPKVDGALDYDELLRAHPGPRAAIDLEPDDPIALMYTSGTTGKPKGALASHRNWLAQTELSAYQIVPMTDEDVVLTGGPFFHIYLVIAVLDTLMVGGTVVAARRFFPDRALNLITEHRATHFMGTPTMWTYLIDEYMKNQERYDVGSLWQGQSAGAPLPAELARRIEETFGIGLVECYGATECASTVTNTRFGHLTPGSPGWPPPGWEIMITDADSKPLPNGQIGELWCRGPGVIKEYWKDPELTKDRIIDGWWRSGDLGYIKSGGKTDGQLFVVDRKDDMILCGGYNIYPTEVEGYLMRHPALLLAVVVGIPHPVKGQIPKAFCVLKPGHTCTEAELIAFGKQNMAAYKVPRAVAFVTMNDLPKTASGKILKRELREQEINQASECRG
ncbi:MAG: AMP-binding protein [Polyangiaceae bacterium]|nr:AMP-binding protein [Polyangiaceae bacterium]